MNPTLVVFILAPLVAVVATVSVNPIKQWAERRKMLAIANERSSHVRPTPVGGGLAIILGAVTGLVLLYIILSMPNGGALTLYSAGGLIIALISWLDDVYTISSELRFAVHVIVSIVLIRGLGPWDDLMLPVGGHVSLGNAGYVLTVIWMVGLINAYNFMDGIDGIAGGTGVVAGLGWFVLTQQIGFFEAAGISMFTAMGCLGFLRRNWAPASIFMGDVGSAFLGYTFAVLPLLFATTNPERARLAPFLGVLIVWPFVFDTSVTFVRRAWRRERVFRAHRSHVYQRLVRTGWTHAQVSTLYVGFAAVGCLLGLLWVGDPVKHGSTALAGPIVLGGLLLALCHYQERRAFDI